MLLIYKDSVIVPFPAWGNVCMQDMRFRGVSNATMHYTHQPWSDYFRVLDDGKESGSRVYLGLWTAHETTGGWFTLTLMPDVETN